MERNPSVLPTSLDGYSAMQGPLNRGPHRVAIIAFQLVLIKTTTMDSELGIGPCSGKTPAARYIVPRAMNTGSHQLILYLCPS